MPMLGCQRCGLVLEVPDPVDLEAPTTRPCHRCSATMRPVTRHDAIALRSSAGARSLNAAKRGPRWML